jgi:hypothetical protein
LAAPVLMFQIRRTAKKNLKALSLDPLTWIGC